MSKIVGIGACVMDTLITVPKYPAEDTKCRANGMKLAGGGPTATGIVAAAKLGESCEFIGVLADDAGGRFLVKDFDKYGVDVSSIDIIKGYRSFTSCIWLNAQKATRTCVFDKGNLPPMVLSDKQKQTIRKAKLLMIDGNEIDAAEQAAKIAKDNGVQVLYDAGGLYDGVERLLKLTDILIPSEEFALGHTGEKSAEAAAQNLYNTYHPEIVVITQGSRGGVIFDGKRIVSYPIYPAKVVDSNGAGDVFHGAFATAVVKGYDYIKCCHFSSAVSAIKCTGIGARESIPDFKTVEEYLKRNGFEL